jgi:hypothetical protein
MAHTRIGLHLLRVVSLLTTLPTRTASHAEDVAMPAFLSLLLFLGDVFKAYVTPCTLLEVVLQRHLLVAGCGFRTSWLTLLEFGFLFVPLLGLVCSGKRMCSRRMGAFGPFARGARSPRTAEAAYSRLSAWQTSSSLRLFVRAGSDTSTYVFH